MLFGELRILYVALCIRKWEPLWFSVSCVLDTVYLLNWPAFLSWNVIKICVPWDNMLQRVLHPLLLLLIVSLSSPSQLPPLPHCSLSKISQDVWNILDLSWQIHSVAHKLFGTSVKHPTGLPEWSVLSEEGFTLGEMNSDIWTGGVSQISCIDSGKASLNSAANCQPIPQPACSSRGHPTTKPDCARKVSSRPSSIAREGPGGCHAIWYYRCCGRGPTGRMHSDASWL